MKSFKMKLNMRSKVYYERKYIKLKNNCKINIIKILKVQLRMKNDQLYKFIENVLRMWYFKENNNF